VKLSLYSWLRAPLTVLLAGLAFGVAANHENGHPSASPADSGSVGALEALGITLPGSTSESEFLDPNVAYVLSAQTPDASTIAVRWDIAEGYYLYRDKFRFTIKDGPGVRLGPVGLPPGKIKEDPYFGQMEVYYGEVEAILPVERESLGPTEITLDVGYQGCADAGLCYPPMTKTVTVAFRGGDTASTPGATKPPVSAQTADTSTPAGDLPPQDRIARTLAGGAGWLVLATFFGFGLLLTFTPCVFPMIPILSSIIVGQGERISTRRAFMLSLTFVLPMSATYTAAGVFAGLFGAGANLQAAFQNPWILSAFIAVFVLLALSMFGFYDLQIPASWQSRLARLSSRQQGGTYIGVGIMGVLSALIVGPCVAAPLAGALIYIGQTGDALLGGMALFALSLGMGAPVLAVGTSGGKLLPKAGPWMGAIKAVFGVALLGVAIYLLERIVPESITLLLWAALVIVSAIYMGALDAVSAGTGGWRRLWKGAGLVMLVYGVLLIVGVTGGSGDLFQPLKGLGGRAETERRGLPFKPVKGMDGLQAELRVAAVQSKPVMLDFYADWCVSCKELERYTFSDPAVQAALADVVLLRTDVTANDAQDQALLKVLGLFGPPAILFFGPDGRERPEFRVVGYVEADVFEVHVRKAVSGGDRSVAKSAVGL
jgi:thiol:disulfide interchange protein DsbD